MRQIVLDTETTGLEPQDGHRIIEIGCVELVNRKLTGNNLHLFINPGRDIEEGALEVHGITLESLQDKPVFAAVAQEFVEYVKDSELIIHNAPFDVGFLDHELSLLAQEGADYGCIADHCKVLDTLKMARQKYPGQRVSLDALCARMAIDNSHRTLHGALLDAELLADVYLIMTGGQSALFAGGDGYSGEEEEEPIERLPEGRAALKVIQAGAGELEAHREMLEQIADSTEDGKSVWQGGS